MWSWYDDDDDDREHAAGASSQPAAKCTREVRRGEALCLADHADAGSPWAMTEQTRPATKGNAMADIPAIRDQVLGDEITAGQGYVGSAVQRVRAAHRQLW